jgi:hypothetical protein
VIPCAACLNARCRNLHLKSLGMLHCLFLRLFQVYPGIFLANGETIQNLDYLRSVGVTHVLNTAERHVPVNPAKYPLHNISYFGFHVDDHPSSNISR